MVAARAIERLHRHRQSLAPGRPVRCLGRPHNCYLSAEKKDGLILVLLA